MKGRILVIDDEAEIRRKLTEGLTQEDYTVVSCEDGISAIHELSRSRDKGIPYDYLITGIFVPDIDGLKILKVIKKQYPDLPVLVITGFGDEELKLKALSENNTGYLDKPFEIEQLVASLNTLSPGRISAEIQEESSGEEIQESISAFLTVKITDTDRSMEIYDILYRMNGIQSCDAVRGDYDIILLAQASSKEDIQQIFNRVRNTDGIEIVSLSEVEQPKLDKDVEQFIGTYLNAVKQEARLETRSHTGTMSYIIIDIDPAAVQRIFTTALFIDEVVFCNVIEDGSKLVGMITDQGTLGRTPRIIEKLNQIDGVLRIREAKVIKLIED